MTGISGVALSLALQLQPGLPVKGVNEKLNDKTPVYGKILSSPPDELYRKALERIEDNDLKGALAFTRALGQKYKHAKDHLDITYIIESNSNYVEKELVDVLTPVDTLRPPIKEDVDILKKQLSDIVSKVDPIYEEIGEDIVDDLDEPRNWYALSVTFEQLLQFHKYAQDSSMTVRDDILGQATDNLSEFAMDNLEDNPPDVIWGYLDKMNTLQKISEAHPEWMKQQKKPFCEKASVFLFSQAIGYIAKNRKYDYKSDELLRSEVNNIYIPVLQELHDAAGTNVTYQTLNDLIKAINVMGTGAPKQDAKFLKT